MRVFLLLFSFVLFATSCDEDSDKVHMPYGDDGISASVCVEVVISESAFQDLEPNQASVAEFAIEDDCLTLKLGIAGCDADHTLNMISSGGIDESLPPQITFDFQDENLQDCEAYFEVDRQFDLTPIRSLIEDDIIIRFRNSDVSILYQK